jgi:hypothetical protein
LGIFHVWELTEPHEKVNKAHLGEGEWFYEGKERKTAVFRHAPSQIQIATSLFGNIQKHHDSCTKETNKENSNLWGFCFRCAQCKRGFLRGNDAPLNSPNIKLTKQHPTDTQATGVDFMMHQVKEAIKRWDAMPGKIM